MSEEWDRREREDDAALDTEHGRTCSACGKDHREDHRGSDGGWVEFPDHEPGLVAELLVP